MIDEVMLVEYMGQEDANGQLLGHGTKVLNEYYHMLKDDFSVSVMAPMNIVKTLKQDISVKSVFDNNTVISEKKRFRDTISNFFIKQRNIKHALEDSNAGAFWFCNIDFSLFFYLAFHKMRRANIIVTMYRKTYGNGIVRKVKGWIVNRAIKKMGLVIVTSRAFSFDTVRCYYMPDYYYDNNKYDRYIDAPKNDVAVCLGTMNQSKKLQEAIDVFNKIKYPLKIIGRFYSDEWMEQLKISSKDNIVIENRYLSEEEYLQLMSEARYCVIPYDKAVYDCRTSGVLQESIFMRCIPISYDWFLEQNKSVGLSLDRLDECDLYRSDYDNYKKWCDDEIERIYNMQVIKTELIKNIRKSIWESHS